MTIKNYLKRVGPNNRPGQLIWLKYNKQVGHTNYYFRGPKVLLYYSKHIFQAQMLAQWYFCFNKIENLFKTVKRTGSSFADYPDYLNIFFRKLAYYILLYYAPLIMFVFASFASFVIPPLDGNDRTCMIVTLFLINVQMSLYITDEGPNAESSTALNTFVNACTGFIFLVIMEYLIILKRLWKYRNNREGIKYEKALEFFQKLDYYASILFPIFYILYVIYHFIYYTQIVTA